MLAHNAAVYDIPFNPLDLYDPPDGSFVAWFGLLVDEVGRTKQQAEQAAG